MSVVSEVVVEVLVVMLVVVKGSEEESSLKKRSRGEGRLYAPLLVHRQARIF